MVGSNAPRESLGELQRERDRLEEQRADRNRLVDAMQQLHDSAGGVEARADTLDHVEPAQRALNVWLDLLTDRCAMTWIVTSVSIATLAKP